MRDPLVIRIYPEAGEPQATLTDLPKYSFLFVEWEDHYTESNWFDPEDMPKEYKEPEPVVSAGWLIDVNEKTVVLAPIFQTARLRGKSGTHAADANVIIRKNILRVWLGEGPDLLSD